MAAHKFVNDPEDWTFDDVEALVVDQVPEGQRLEYKGKLLLNKPKEKAEAAKDASGLANAQGGWLIYGVSEDKSPEPLPVAVTPFPADGLQTRLEDILDSTLQPRVNYRAATLRNDAGQVVILIKVEQNSGAPSMVQGYDQYRYFIRSGTRTIPMSADQVEQAHMAARSRSRRALERLSDLPLVADLDGIGQTIGTDDFEPPPTVCLVASAMDWPDELFDRQLIANRNFEEPVSEYRGRETMRSGRRWEINAHGLIDEYRSPPPESERDVLDLSLQIPISPDDDRLVAHRIAIYRAGVFEWVLQYSTPGVPGRHFAENVHDMLKYGAHVFSQADYLGRLAVWVTVEHAEETPLILANGADVNPRLPGVETLKYEGQVTLDQIATDPTPIVRDAMDTLWQGFGLTHCLLFDTEGNWAS